ncbi:MAG: gliding motility-associated C-terminal domain-containing protein [Adhaeribacter sp.]
MHVHIPFKSFFLFCVFCVLLLGLNQKAQATHIRAGEIIAKSMADSLGDPFLYRFKLITFTDFALTNADNPTATMFFGTGDKQTVDRHERRQVRSDTYRSVYYFFYRFPGPGSYTVTYTEVNRAIRVMNIGNSENQSELLRTTITIDPFIGQNTSPELKVPPLDYASCNQPFVHNPGAYDRDGDKLVFKFVPPQRNTSGDQNNPVAGPVADYRVLNDPSFGCSAAPNGGPSTLTIDPNTGQITWNSPCQQGDYNVAFVVEEYRNGRKIGETLRDMQIRVRCGQNKRPILQAPRDTCVIAGNSVTGIVRASDPDNNPLTLEAFSGILPPATFRVSGNTGTFNWNTVCGDVQAEPYQVVFKVTDNPGPNELPLTDLQPWNIRVIGPAPENFKVTPVGRNITLNWDSYTCQNASKIYIYRREGNSNFVPGPCETGVPASAGFTKIGEVNANVTTYTDNGGATGLKRGVTYCYVIYAVFPAPKGGESIATLPVCTMLENNMPVLTHVTVQTTDPTNGSILVKWVKPVEGLQNLIRPLQYRLLRAPGGSDNFTEVFRTSNIDETSFLDTNISTSAGAGDVKWIYKLEFYHNPGGTPEMVDTAVTATSVQLKATTQTSTVSLAWTYTVPWDNSKRPHYIYRKMANGAYELIDSTNATTTRGEYVDRGTFKNTPLKQGVQYCYYVTTNGTYNNPRLPDPLLNNSQEFCVTLRDTIPPCPPVLSIDPLDCDAFVKSPTAPPYQNVLTWVPDTSPECAQDIKYYTVYFRSQDTEEAQFDSINFTPNNITTFTHSNLQSFAGCYMVTATDSAGNESKPSNIVCKENCFFFQLPNIFTPNNDGKNDTFQPDPRSLFIKSIKFTAFSRWGEKVYEGADDPRINWQGVNNAGKKLADGVYYYLAEVEFITSNPQNAKKTYKGWVEIVR